MEIGSSTFKPNLFRAARLLLLPLLIMGCTTAATDYRQVGFTQIQRGFERLPKNPNLHRVIHLENVTVHIVGDRRHFKWEKAAAYGSPIAGYATRRNEIYVFGAIVDGKVVVNQAILGHELNHLLQFKEPEVQDPDKLDDLGA